MVACANFRSCRLPRGLPVGAPAGLLVGLAAASLLTGCAGNRGSAGTAAAGAPASHSPAASSSASGPQESPLSKGLLPPSAFGSQATVVSLTLQQFQQATSGKLGATDGVKVEPPECATALRSTQPDVG